MEAWAFVEPGNVHFKNWIKISLLKNYPLPITINLHVISETIELELPVSCITRNLKLVDSKVFVFIQETELVDVVFKALPME